MRTFRLAQILIVALPLVAACGGPLADETALDGPDDEFLVDGKADAFGIREGSAEACGVLKLASEASREVLNTEARLDRRAAENIVAYRKGPDGVAATDDDQRFDTLAELDAVKYVGRVAFGKLVKYVRAKDGACRDLSLQVVAVSDVHGQLEPSSVKINDVATPVGGAPVLARYVRNARTANPNTLFVSAGDLFGASPPLSMYFEEKPMVEAANAMRLHVNAVGNHEFDRGLAHLRSMIELARFPFVSANLGNLRANLTCPSKPSARCIEPYTIVPMSGVKVALIGLTTPETPVLVKPGSLGTITITDPVAAARTAREAAKARGAQVFVLVAHIGGAAPAGAQPTGPIVDLARQITGFDAVIGGHTHTQISAVVNGVPVVENSSQTQSFARITLKYDFTRRTVVERLATVEQPLAAGVDPDPAVVELLAPYRAELAAAFDVPIGLAAGIFEQGGTPQVERIKETALGDLVADAVRHHTGTQIAFLNGGGLRAPIPSSYTPADHMLRRPAPGYAAGLPYHLVLGDVFSVLPFGNAVATQTITGAQLWTMLEHAVDALPAGKGYFAQISGFKFEFDSLRPLGSSRVHSVKLDNGTPIAKDATPYTMTTSDFLSLGGDGYSLLASVPAQAGDPMADILSDYIRELRTITPATSGRIIDRPAQ